MLHCLTNYFPQSTTPFNINYSYYTLILKRKKEASKLLTKSKYFSNLPITIITNVLRTPKPYKTKAFKSICRLLVALPKRHITPIYVIASIL